jgi:TonB family protein
MKLSLTPLLILLFVAIKSFSQETKEIVEISGEKYIKKKIVYHVLLDNILTKHGPYEEYINDKLIIRGFYKMDKKDSVWQRYSHMGTLLSKKTYSDNKKIGVWEFYQRDGAADWQYDFNKDSSTNKSQISPVYSYQSLNGEWLTGKADREPVWLCSSSEWQFFLNRTLRYPNDAIRKNKMGKVTIEIMVNENGDAIEYNVAESAYPSLDAEALRVMELFHSEFSPAEKDGKKVKTKVQLPITFRLERG